MPPVCGGPGGGHMIPIKSERGRHHLDSEQSAGRRHDYGGWMLPFTHDQFIALFAAYNAAVWPAQVLADLMGIATCVALWRATRPLASFTAAAALAAMWIWTGAVYQGLFFSRINQAAVAFGVLFVLQGILFVAAHRQLEFGPGGAKGVRGAAGWALIAYAMLLYPLLGWLAGMSLAEMPSFGITPCPVTLFTWGVLLLATRPPWWLLPIPLAWSLIGGSAAILLRVPQDWVLLASAVLALPLGRSSVSTRRRA